MKKIRKLKVKELFSGSESLTLKKILKMVRFTVFFFFLSIIQIMAVDSYSQTAKLSLNVTNEPLENVLKTIEDESEFFFLYNKDLIDVEQKISIDVTDQSIKKVLVDLFVGKDISFVVYDRQIVLSNIEVIDKMVAQQKGVTGTVTDENGEPLPGVTVIIKGTTKGAVTDIEGNYKILFNSEETVLVFSFVGMKTQDIVAGSQSVINVTLLNEAIGLDEVIAIGYGTIKKSDMTGSVSAVRAKDFENVPIQRMEEVLQGRASGVTVTNASGSPASNIRIRIRGANSINGGNEPLYVVDGVTDSYLFKSLDVNDIASIEVLKDASATAIYGSRGANGVILVTTKKGKKKEFNMTFETQQSYATIAKQYNMLSAAEYAGFYNEYRRELGSDHDYFSPEEIAEFEKTGGTDWQDLMFNNAYTQNYKLSISGGADNVDYIVSGNVRSAEGILVGSTYDKYNLRANLNAQTFNWLKINFSVNGSYSKAENDSESSYGHGSVIATALTYSPTNTLYDAKGNWVADNISSVKDNPYGVRVQDKRDRDTKYFASTLNFTIDLPVEGLTLSILGFGSYRNVNSYALFSQEKNLHPNNYASNSNGQYSKLQNTNVLTYDRKFGKHKLKATVVAEYNKYQTSSLYVSSNNLLTESVGYWNLGIGTVGAFGNSYSKSTLSSYVGRVSYQFNNKYLLSATLRRDGSSKFQGDNKWGNFPSASAAWRVSEESFIKDLGVFDQFKIRTSYGVTGNQAIGPYSTLGLLQRANYGWGSSNNYPGYWAQNLPTPDLSWEKTYQFDIGVDLGFFDNKLRATIDLYKKDTKDLLLRKAIPYYNGGGSVYKNLGHVRNNGYDISIGTNLVETKDVKWESNLNFAYSKNEVIDMGGDERLFVGARNNTIGFQPYVLEVGESMGSLWGYTWLGLWGTNDVAEAEKYGQKPGDNHFLDVNSDYVINSDDQGVIGKAFPDYTLGWNNTISVNNFDFNIFFQGVFGADRLNLTRYTMSEATSDAKFITSKEGYYNLWTPDNQDTNIPNIYSVTTNTQGGSTQYLESADFVRLKNLSVAYNIPFKKSSSISNFKISCSVQNVFTITSYSGYDPEVTGSISDTQNGIEFGAYPLARTYTLGLQLIF